MYSPSEAAKVPNYATVVGEEKIIRIYPYELVNVNHSETFVKPNAIAIPFIQNHYDEEFENNILIKDESANYYFEAWFDPTATTVLDSASHTSVYGKEVKEELSIWVRSNWMYQREASGIKLGNGATMVPAFFTVGRPFELEDYVNGTQDLFFTQEITTIKEQYQGNLNVSDGEGDYEFQLINIKNLEASETNFRILAQDKFDFSKFDSFRKDTIQDSEGLMIGLENHTLFGGLKIRGVEDVGITVNQTISVGNAGLGTNQIREGLHFLKSDIDALDLHPEFILKFTLTYNTPATGNKDKTEVEEIKWGRAIYYTETAKGDEYPTSMQDQEAVRIMNHTSYLLKRLPETSIKELKFDIIKPADLNRGAEVGSIDTRTKESMMPFKMTPINNDDKIEMFADWFDYDVVMPYFMAKTFANPANLDEAVNVKETGGTITNPEDKKLIIDMLTYSAAFADNFSKVTLTTDNKIDPTWKIGSEGTSVANIVGQDPVKIIDGLYESHIRKHPSFQASRERQQRVKSTICALSRYIYSSYSIGNGQNNFNNLYLPWFLEAASSDEGKIDYTRVDNGSHVINPDVKFQVKSIYFSEKFTIPNVNEPTNDITIPKEVNTSRTITMQTDRKITLPTIPETLPIIDKLPLPTDVDTQSSKDLAYLWWLPIKTKEKMEAIMLDTSKTISRPAGTEVTVIVANTSPGHLKTEAEIIAEVNAQVPSTIVGKVSSYVTVQTTPSGVCSIEQDEINLVRTTYQVSYRGHTFTLSKTKDGSGPSLEDQFAKAMGYSLGSVVFPEGFTTKPAFVYMRIDLKSQEFTPFKVTTLYPANITISFNERASTFDKETWRMFLKDMGIVESSKTVHHFVPIKETFITSIRELELKTLWGNWVDIFYNSNQTNGYIRVPLFNEDDETITKQRLIFT